MSCPASRTHNHPLTLYCAVRRFGLAGMCWVLVSSLGWQVPVLAGSGGVFRMAGRQSGVVFSIDTRWIDGNGQRPLRVTVSNLPPSAAPPVDRTFTVTFSMELRESVVVRATDVITLRQGQVSASKVICVPQWSNWSGCKLAVSEGGRDLEDVSGELAGFATGTGDYDWTEIYPTVLVIDRDAPTWNVRSQAIAGLNNRFQLPDFIRWDELVPQPQQSQTYYATPSGMMVQTVEQSDTPAIVVPSTIIDARQRNDAEILLGLQNSPRTEILATDDVPERWIELTSADIIFLPLDDAAYLQRSAPEKWHAIRSWTAVGHTLVVTGVGDSLARLPELEQLLEWPGQLEGDAGNLAPQQQLDTGWRLPDANDYGAGFKDAHKLRGADIAVSESSSVPAPLFQLRGFELGHVLAFSADDAIGDPAQLAWALCSLEPHHWSWSMRHGFSLRRDNSDYWSWRIPGVGVPPVKTFLALITLFALVIGPVNYVFLSRRKRLTLLMVSVPVGGVLATVTLLLFAIISDGLGARVRTRSLTMLDQQQGQAVTWSRQTYYCGLTPSSGLVWSDNVTAYPINFITEVPGQQRGAPPTVNWTSGQSLRGNFIRPREMQQYMVIESGANTARLDIDAAEKRVINELGGEISMLLVNSGDAHLLARDIGQGQTGRLEEIAGVAVTKAVTEMFSSGDEDPVSGMPYYAPGMSRYRYGYFRSVDANLPQPTLKMSVLNRHLNALGLGQLDLPAGSYLAVVRNPSWLPVGVADAEREACFDVVFGRY
jgi:hypothetical protein